MKKILSTIASILGVILFIYIFWIRPEYNWSNKILENQTSNDWILVTKSYSSEIIKPWTWFQKPVDGLWFAKKNDLARYSDSLMIGHIYIATYFSREHKEYEYYVVCNCMENEIARLREPAELTKFGLTKAKWEMVPEDSQTKDLLEFYCSKNKKHTAIDNYGNEFDITNYILSGQYSLIDSSIYHLEIKNNNPYLLALKDEKLLHSAIVNWLEKMYPDQTFDTMPSIFSKTKYYTTDLSFGKPSDIYIVEVTPSSQIGLLRIEIELSFDYDSKLNPNLNKINVLGKMESERF